MQAARLSRNLRSSNWASRHLEASVKIFSLFLLQVMLGGAVWRSLQILRAKSLLMSVWRGTLETFLATGFTKIE